MKRNYRYDKWFKVQSFKFKVLFGLVLILLSSCSENNSEQKSNIQHSRPTESSGRATFNIYYCPMHPEVQQDHPGKCPKAECHGMPLVLKKSGDPLASVLKSTSSNALSKIKIVHPEFKKLPIQVEASGYIDYDNFSKYDISSRYSGRIDKLYIKYNYQPIHKGDVVFEVYSADLVTAQENLLYLLKTSPEEKELINAAKQKLKLLQLTSEQIDEIIKTNKITNAIPVFSKFDGHIHEMIDSPMPASAMSDYQKSPLLAVKEGMYVERGKILFNVVDPSKVVVMLKIKAADISIVHLGEPVRFCINNDTTMIMNGKIDFIEPVFSANTKTLMVRVNMDNEGHKHKIGSLVNATIISDSLQTLWVPVSSVVDLGKTKIVWVQADGNFKAVKVETGAKSNGMIEISDGLIETDNIAAEAHYLSDSEGFIKIEDNEN